MNDLGNTVQHSNHKLYADDTVIYSKLMQGEEENLPALQLNIQIDLSTNASWCKINAILINVNKTQQNNEIWYKAQT